MPRQGHHRHHHESRLILRAVIKPVDVGFLSNFPAQRRRCEKVRHRAFSLIVQRHQHLVYPGYEFRVTTAGPIVHVMLKGVVLIHPRFQITDCKAVHHACDASQQLIKNRLFAA